MPFMEKLDVTILYVEDAKEIQLTYCRFLEKRFVKVILADNGEEGLKAFKDNHVDLVLSDLRMPVMNGLVMSEKIREINGDIPIVILTAHEEEEYRHKADALKIAEYLLKPVRPKILTDALSKLILDKNVEG
jgi:YesN/AraC family two-component response regulator